MTHDPHATGTASPFSETELHQLHSEDVAGGKAIVVLIGGIFIVGVVLYSFVAWWVS